MAAEDDDDWTSGIPGDDPAPDRAGDSDPAGPEGRSPGLQGASEEPAGLRDQKGRFRRSASALARFLSKCRFDPITGCVNWVGGKTRGRGKTSWYGSFWYDGRPWKAHRWAARFIHGLEIDGLEVDHECGNTLCVHHLQAVTGPVNREWYWIRVEVGLIEEEPSPEDDPDGIPWYDPPPWFAATYSRACPQSDEPPF